VSHSWLTLVGLVLLTGACGCQWIPRSRLTASETQNRALVERTRALEAEVANLRAHSREAEEQLRLAEDDLARLDEAGGLDRKRLANFQVERERLHDQFTAVARGTRGLPRAVSERLSRIAEGYGGLRVDAETGIGRLDMDILFETADATLRPEAARMLDEFAAVLKSPDASELHVMVVGHSDDQLVANKPTRELYPNNWHLSAARALSVVDYLERAGVRDEQLGVASFASHQPITADEGDRSKNRRVEIFVTGPETPIVGWTETIPNLY